MTIGNHIIHLSSVDSTNTYLKGIAKDVTEGTVVLADQQTQGRGRFGRSWFANSGSFTFSFLVQPDLPLEEFLLFTLYPAISVVKVLNFLYVPASLKWPNDILLNGKKIGGILAERISINKKPAFIVGIGLNLQQAVDEFPKELAERAGSVFSETGRLLDREAFFKTLLRQLNDDYQCIQKAKCAAHLRQEWLSFCAHLNEPITVTFQDNSINGRFLGITKTGTAQIETQNKVFEVTNVTEFILRANHATGN